MEGETDGSSERATHSGERCDSKDSESDVQVEEINIQLCLLTCVGKMKTEQN